MRSDLKILRRAYADFTRVPFPKSSPDPEAAELHVALVDYTSWICGLISWLEEGYNSPPYPLEPDTKLRRRTEQVAREGSPGASSDARRYLTYLDEIDKLIKVSKSVMK